ncbi:hypothetical protein LFYK43_22430 [Ligilactobacillus salitolerans]|uniref:Uncharacterized protein n=1 Tax=Ligilactobacillus salitolerans TaxID=1808352 RepID=A0A401IW71_9LACO|nr:hypothetical protein [Ligilactobacillus salitolerans]GBG95784.1 hypothetical protein LFYK43_22430 [Ligilactobacillus salitolerans]
MQKRSILLDPAGIRQLYSQANEDNNAAITNSTKMIIDTHKLNLPRCQSLLLDKKMGIIFTKASTNTLVKRFISWQACNFSIPAFIMHDLYHDQAPRHIVPFVSGKQILLPLGGYVHSSTSWIVLSNLISYHCFGKNRIGLQFCKKHAPDYTIIANHQEFERTYRSALIIAEIESQLVEQLNKEFPSSFISATHSQMRQLYPDRTAPRVSFQNSLTAYTDKIVEDTLAYNSSLINEEPDQLYLTEVKRAIKDKHERLR